MSEDERVQRAMLSEAPTEMLIAEVCRRGYVVARATEPPPPASLPTSYLWDGEQWLICTPKDIIDARD